MQLECIHFVHDVRIGPGNMYDLIGNFSTLAAHRFPYPYHFWVFARLRLEPDEAGAVVPVTFRSTAPNGAVEEFTERPVQSEPSGRHPPMLFWRTEVDALFPVPGYYSYEILDTEFGQSLGKKRLLLTSR